MEDFSVDSLETESNISLWTFDCFQSLSALPPFCDTANTNSIPGQTFSEWFGNIEVPEIKYKVLIGSIDKFSHCGLLIKAHILCIIEKYLATRARCVTLFKTNMERMRYKISCATERDAKEEIKQFADTMNTLSTMCKHQITFLIMNGSHRKYTKKNFLNNYTNQENEEIMRVILSTQINKKISEDLQLNLAYKLSREINLVKTLLKDRKAQIKKFAKGLIQRPSWIPSQISDDYLLRYTNGEILSIPQETQPEIDFSIHSSL